MNNNTNESQTDFESQRESGILSLDLNSLQGLSEKKEQSFQANSCSTSKVTQIDLQSEGKIFFIYSPLQSENSFIIKVNDTELIADIFTISPVLNDEKTYIIQVVIVNSPKQSKIDLVLQRNESKFICKDITINPQKNNYLFNIKFGSQNIFNLFSQNPSTYDLTELGQFDVYIDYFKIVKKTPDPQLIRAICPYLMKGQKLQEKSYLKVFESIRNEKTAIELLPLFSLELYIKATKEDKMTYDKIIKAMILRDSKARIYLKELDSPILTKKLDLIELYYRYQCKDSEFFDCLRFAGEVIGDFIKLVLENHNPKAAPLFTSSEMSILILHVLTTKTLKDMLMFCKPEDFPSFYLLNRNILQMHYHTSKLKLSDFITPSKDQDINSLMQSFCRPNSNTLDTSIDKDDLADLLKKYIELYNSVNFDYLLTINDFLKVNYGKELTSKIKEALFRTGYDLIITKKVSNKLVLTYLTECESKHLQKLKEIEWTNLGRAIKLEKLSDDDIFLFKKIPLKDIYEYHYQKFLKELISPIANINKFSIIFKVIPSEDNSREVWLLIKSSLIKSIENIDKLNEEVLYEPIKLFIEFLKSSSSGSYIVNSITSLSKSIGDGLVISIFTRILHEIDMSQERQTEIIKELVKRIENEPIVEVSNFIFSFKKVNLIQLLFAQLEKFIFTQEVFFNKEEDRRLTLYYTLKDKGDNLHQKYQQTPYFTQANKVVNEVKRMLEEIDLSKKQLKQLKAFSNTELEKRVKYFFSEYDEKKNSVYNKINKAICLYFSTGKALKEVIDYYSNYHTSKQGKLTQFKDLQVKLNTEKIFSFLNNQSQYEEMKKIITETPCYITLTQSYFFKAIYNTLKIVDEDKKLQETFTAYSKIKGIVTDFNNFIKTEDSIREKLFEKTVTDVILEEEIMFIQKYFKLQPVNAKDIIEKLQLIKEKPSIIRKATSVLSFIKLFNEKETSLTSSLAKHLELMINNWDFAALTQFCADSTISQFQFLNESLDESYSLFEAIADNKDIFLYLMKQKEADVRQLNEFAHEVNVKVSKNTVNNLFKVVVFLSKIKSRQLVDLALIQAFFNLHQEKEFKGLLTDYLDVSHHIKTLKELHEVIVDKDVSHKQNIEKILNHSVFLIQFQEGQYKCIADGKSFEPIIELRDKSLFLSKTSEKDKDRCDQSQILYYETCKAFASLIDSIILLYSYVIKLNNKGYPESPSFEIIVNKGEASISSTSLDRKIEETKRDLSDLIEEQIKGYSNCKYIPFFYGKRFSLFFKFLCKGAFFNVQVVHFLNYLTNNQCKKIISYKYQRKYTKLSKDMIENIENYLSELFKANNISLSSIYKSNLIKSDKKKRGICLLEASSNDYERTILNWYLALTGNTPIAHTILLSSEYTSIEEITAFLYRALKCNDNVLFFLIRPDTFDLETRREIISIMSSLYSFAMSSFLVVLYSDKSCELINHLRKLPGILPTLHFEMKQDQLNFAGIGVICSDASGLGKSRQIKSEFGEKYVYFPLGGEFTQKRIAERLSGLLLQNGSGIHLDLMETRQLSLMRHFLFSFLFTKCYYYHEDLFYLGKDIQITIEIPFGFFDFMETFPILKLLKSRRISFDNMKPLIVPSGSLSNLQIVCNYLNNLNKISSKDIFIPYPKYTPSKESITVIPLSEKKCRELIKQHFPVPNATYYQINSFIDILATQLTSFSLSCYLKVDLLKTNGQVKGAFQLHEVRALALDSLIKVTISFTEGAYNHIIKQQRNTSTHQQAEKYDEGKAREDAIQILSEKKAISFDIINPSLVFFNEDRMSIGIITTAQSDSIEYQRLKELFNSARQDNALELPNYKAKTAQEFLIEVKRALNLKNCVTEKEATEKKSRMKSIESIVGSYVFTADNYIKMIFIILRLRAKVPVIMMGETGCGKTSLIRMIAELINKKIRILNIHAGISDEDIISFIIAITASESNTNSKEDIWVFLDEINTCHSMGLISEMMCKHTMEGEPISDKIIFIAACNPYRTYTKKVANIGLVKKEQKKERCLVYDVHPLPHSLLNFVFDFGKLTEKDEEKYIESMVKPSLEKSKGDCFFVKCSITAIVNAQKLIQKQNDTSSVSLREVRRVVIIYEWFIDFLTKLNELPNTFRKKDIFYQLEAIILSIYLCFYVRILDESLRKEFRDEINKVIACFKPSTIEDMMLEIPDRVQKEVMRRMNIPKGIADNRALKENLFTLFVCVINRIPVFICGKPGCSKSLSVQLFNNAMKGEYSDEPLFKMLPRLQMCSYQGSLTSTSLGVESIFSRAREGLTQSANKKVIQMIYFDEMGLAEISKNNPLKVIHSQLEYDDNEVKVAFVGISNWVLDASKMNRGIFLSIPDFSKEDLVYTAKAIASSINSNYDSISTSLFESLAIAYYNYKERLRSGTDINSDFHGSRDFYHLIKNAAKNLSLLANPSPSHIKRIARESIERNFGGTENSIKLFKQIYSQEPLDEANETYNIVDCIKRNITDEESRYMILISKSSINSFLFDSILKQDKERSYLLYMGSQFEKDQDDKYFNVKILNKIKHCMEQGTILALMNLEIIYPSLYDLFNQNFSTYAGQSYAKIAFGSTKTTALVHENFKCVILLNQEEMEKQDPPFLNRFEKQIISLEHLLDDKLKAIANKVNDYLRDILKPKNNSRKLKFNLSLQLVNCDIEEIEAMVYMKSLQGIRDDKAIEDKLLQIIVPTFSQDIMGFAYYSTLKDNKQLFERIVQNYNTDAHQSLQKFIDCTKHYKTVVYTFSSVFEAIIIKNQTSVNSVEELLLSSIRCESEFESIIRKFYQNKEKSICLIRFTQSDLSHMNHLKYVIDLLEKEGNFRIQKRFIMIIHLKRALNQDQSVKKLNNRDLISHLADYYQIFIDNLNGVDIKLTDVFNYSTKELFLNSVIDLHETFKANVSLAYMKLKYNYINGASETNDNDLMSFLAENEEIAEEAINCILREVEKEDNYLLSLYCDNPSKDKHKDFISFNKNEDIITNIKTYLEESLLKLITRLLIQLETNALLSPLLLEEPVVDEIIPFLLEQIQQLKLSKVKPSMNEQSNEINKVNRLSLPGSFTAIKKLLQHVKELHNEFFSNDQMLRMSHIEDKDIQAKLNQFNHTETSLSDNVYNEMLKTPFIYSLITNTEENASKITNLFIRDYYVIYLSDHYQKYHKEVIEYIKLLVKLRFKEPKDAFNALAQSILWLESNESIIKMLVDLFLNLFEYKPNLIVLLDQVLTRNEIKDPSPEYRKKVNWPFYFVFEALLKNTLNDASIFEGLNDGSFFLYLETLKKIAQSGIKIELNLKYTSYELIFLQSFVNIFDCLWQKKRLTKDNLIQHLNNMRKEMTLIQTRQEEKLIKHLKEEYTALNKQPGDPKNFSRAYISILIGKYKQYSSDEYLLAIMRLVLSNEALIIGSTPLMHYYFKKYNIQLLTRENAEVEDVNDTFMSFRDDNTKSLLLLNNSEKPIVKEFLLFYFQKAINVFFSQLATNEEKILGMPLQYFEIAVNYIENISQCDDLLKRLALIYSMSYVKVYLFYYVDISFSGHLPKEKLAKINRVIIDCSSPLLKVIEVYILKLLGKYIRYDEIVKEDWEVKCQMTWVKELTVQKEGVLPPLIDHSFISNPLTYKERSQEKKMLPLFDFLFDATIRSHTEANTARNALPIAFQSIPIKDSQKEFLLLFYDLSKSKTIFHGKDMEMWLYCYRLCLLCLNQPKSWYFQLFNKDLLNHLKESFVPGAEIKETIRVISTIFVEEYLNNPQNIEAIYICSCGEKYIVSLCGNTAEFLNCLNCKEDIGGIQHSMVKREGHVRVFLNDAVYKNESSAYSRHEQLIWGKNLEKTIEHKGKPFGFHKDFILLDDLKKRTIDQINTDAYKGIQHTSYSFFLNKGKWMRKMSQVSYRLLSLILYSILHFGHMLGYITGEQLQPLLAKDKKCFHYINNNWQLLKEELIKLGINSLFIFLNMIFEDLEKAIDQHQKFNTKEERDAFEVEINSIVEKGKANYLNYEKEYRKINSDLLHYDMNSIRALVNELETPEFYSQQDYYSYYKYFMLDNCQILNHIKEDLENNTEKKSSYPILSNYLSQGEKIKRLSNLLKINPFANYMLNVYNYTITRDQADSISLGSILDNDQSLAEMYKDFEEGWNASKVEGQQYNSNLLIEKKALSKKDSIAFALNDEGVIHNGMHLASYYQYFIKYQNDFLGAIASRDNTNCSYFKESVAQKIMVQDATRNEVVSFDINQGNSPYDSFEELINCFTSKECFDDKGNIDYSLYSSIAINYSQIEEALGVILLPGKRMFITTQRFMNYGFEGSRGDKSSIITDYIAKYPQKELSEEHRNILKEYAKNPRNSDDMLFSLPHLIFFILKNNYLQFELLTYVMNSLPRYINLQCRAFFVANNTFNVNQLIKVFEYFEQQCFPHILDNLDVTIVKEELPEKAKQIINDYFNALGEGRILNRLNISTATRRFISRKLSGKRTRNEVKGQDQLCTFIVNDEYWPEAILVLEGFEEEFNSMQVAFSLILNCHAVSFYNFLGGDKETILL